MAQGALTGRRQRLWQERQKRRDARAMASASGSSKLRRLLSEDGIHPLPCCHDALSAKLIHNAGFEATFLSGFTTSAAKIAQPDCGLITPSEMLDQARAVTEAVPELALLVDADTGGGNAMNVQRTVRGYSSHSPPLTGKRMRES